MSRKAQGSMAASNMPQQRSVLFRAATTNQRLNLPRARRKVCFELQIRRGLARDMTSASRASRRLRMHARLAAPSRRAWPRSVAASVLT